MIGKGILLVTLLVSAAACASSANTSKTASAKMEEKVIQGKIVLRNPTFVSQTGVQKILLLKGDKVIAQTESTDKGDFELKGNFENGKYTVKIDSKTLIGSAPVTVESNEVKNFKLSATLGSPQL